MNSGKIDIAMIRLEAFKEANRSLEHLVTELASTLHTTEDIVWAAYAISPVSTTSTMDRFRKIKQAITINVSQKDIYRALMEELDTGHNTLQMLIAMEGGSLND